MIKSHVLYRLSYRITKACGLLPMRGAT
ncbi:protein of unknown function (plasmid) [Azospirillum baldaniorum]|uniref:Uncharacterized protein n=1 Tax=Azospirillum baldaniorum TaxID=1064539 RepID=A0A9P1NNW1_9PROT|nr:protein of unknown function [Azospirillum baldaniorum]